MYLSVVEDHGLISGRGRKFSQFYHIQARLRPYQPLSQLVLWNLSSQTKQHEH
jgi:hypothetical protein